MEVEPVGPVLGRLAVVEQRHGGVRPGGGEEEACWWKDDEPEVAQGDDREEVSREVEPEERRPGLGVPVDGSVLCQRLRARTRSGQSEVLPPTGLARLSSAG